MEATSQLYRDAMQLTVTKPTVSYTTTISDSRGFISTTTRYQDNPTPEERAERRLSLQRASRLLHQTLTENDTIENIAFHRHLQALNIVTGQLVTPQISLEAQPQVEFSTSAR